MPTVESILEEALTLSSDDRELLAGQILCTIEKDPGWDEAWAAELDRRWAAVQKDPSLVMDWDEGDEVALFGEP
jgi:putative addiction module component (TIGR02574 family)